MAKAPSIPLETQLACVSREVALRERVYPRWVAAGRMTQAKADAEIAAMKAVEQTLLSLVPPDAQGAML